MEKSNTIVNGIKLQDGRIIQGYPIQQDAVMEEAKETPVLDKTGGYFSIKKKPAKPKPTDEEERYLQKLFTDNAFLILANRERILNDSRMLLTPVSVRNGLAYSGAFQTATLGVYIEWWINAPYSVLFDEKDDAMSLIWYLSGSPLSGGNLCSMVTEDGKTEMRVPFFRKLWPKFADIIADYHEPKKLYQAYTLPEVIDILKRETTEEFYKESIRQFHYEAKIRLLNAELDGWKDRWKRTQETCDDYQHKWHIALINSRLDKVKSFYEDYMQRKEALHIRKEELTEDNHNLKARLRKGELTNKEYQQLLTKNKKEVENMDFDMHCFRKDRLAALFPEMAEHFNGRDEIKYTEERILDEIIELFSKDNADN